MRQLRTTCLILPVLILAGCAGSLHIGPENREIVRLHVIRLQEADMSWENGGEKFTDETLLRLEWGQVVITGSGEGFFDRTSGFTSFTLRPDHTESFLISTGHSDDERTEPNEVLVSPGLNEGVAGKIVRNGTFLSGTVHSYDPQERKAVVTAEFIQSGRRGEVITHEQVDRVEVWLDRPFRIPTDPEKERLLEKYLGSESGLFSK